MKKLIRSFLGTIFLIFFVLISNVNALENESIFNYQKKIVSEYAEKFCNAKNEHFFDGLDKEKTLKYSYFNYVGFQRKNILTIDMFKTFINQIKGKCSISLEEESELSDYFLD
tara:strand:- start:203 stop:541 length:339 start_codon:yes stop_codon:yes gene_type:complete